MRQLTNISCCFLDLCDDTCPRVRANRLACASALYRDLCSIDKQVRWGMMDDISDEAFDALVARYNRMSDEYDRLRSLLS